MTEEKYSKLMESVLCGDVEMVQELLEDKYIINKIVSDQNYALIAAARRGYLDIVNKLLEYPLVRVFAAVDENAALRFAAGNGCEWEDVEDREESDYGDNFWPRRASYRGIMEKLLECEPVRENIAVRDNEALRLSVFSGDLYAVEKLLGYDRVRDNLPAQRHWVLRYAMQKGRFEVVNKLLAYPAVEGHIVANGDDVLYDAVWGANVKVIKRLLEYPSVVNNVAANNNEALRCAAENGHYEVVKVLLDYPAVKGHIVANGYDVLYSAVLGANVKVIKRLLEYPEVGDKIADNDNAILRFATMQGVCAYIEPVKVLLEYKKVRDNIAAKSDVGQAYGAFYYSSLFEDQYPYCYLIAQRCWGSEDNVPQDLKEYSYWPRIRNAIHQGEKVFDGEVWARGYYVELLLKDSALKANIEIDNDNLRKLSGLVGSFVGSLLEVTKRKIGVLRKLIGQMINEGYYLQKIISPRVSDEIEMLMKSYLYLNSRSVFITSSIQGKINRDEKTNSASGSRAEIKRAKLLHVQGIEGGLINKYMVVGLISRGLFQQAIYDGRNNNVQARREFDNKYGLVRNQSLWNSSVQPGKSNGPMDMPPLPSQEKVFYAS